MYDCDHIKIEIHFSYCIYNKFLAYINIIKRKVLMGMKMTSTLFFLSHYVTTLNLQAQRETPRHFI